MTITTYTGGFYCLNCKRDMRDDEEFCKYCSYDELAAQLTAAQERIAELEKAQEWRPVSIDEIFRQVDDEPNYQHAIRGYVYHTLRTADGQRVIVRLPDDVRICRRRPAQEETTK